MQRTPLTTPPAVSSSSSLFSSLRQRKLQLSPPSRCGETPAPHCLFSPIHYERGYAYPLVIWLHGPQSCELELQQVMPLISVRNYVGVAPRGTAQALELRGFYDWASSPEDVAEATSRVIDCLQVALRKYNIHRDRIFLAGYGTGGTMALRIGIENPELFAGVCSFGGRVPRGRNVFRNLRAARSLPLMIAVSPGDEEYDNRQVQEDIKLLHVGGFKLNMGLYAGGGGLVPEMFSDLDVWLMSQFCPVECPAS